MGENEEEDLLTCLPIKCGRGWGQDGFGRTPLTPFPSETFRDVQCNSGVQDSADVSVFARQESEVSPPHLFST